MKLQLVILVLLFYCVHPVLSRVIVALLGLHSDANCTIASPTGATQLANLRRLIRELNAVDRQTTAKTDLIILDTCSAPEVAVQMTLRALVMVEDIGLQAPNFLGFLGPYDWPSLQLVSPITKVFGLTHVVPYTRGKQLDNVLSVVNQDIDEHSKSAIALMKYLQWTAVLLVNAGDLEMSERIVNLAQDDNICVMTASVNNPDALRQGAESVAGVMILTNMLGEVPEVNGTLIVMELESAEPEVYGLNLLAAAGSMMRKNMTSQEWIGALRSTTAFRKGKKIQFGMEMPVLVHLRLAGEIHLRKVGNVTGEDVLLNTDLQIPVVNVTSCLVPAAEHGLYMMVGMMTGIAIGLVLCLLCGIYIVHTAFRAPSDSNS